MTTMYSVEEILRQNVADLERELQRQRERAELLTGSLDRAESVLQNLMSYLSVNGCRTEIDPENAELRIRDGIDMLVRPVLELAKSAEAELKEAREQKPVGYVFSDWRGATTISATKDNHFSVPLYASPIPAPAPEIPDGDDFNGTTPHMIQCIEALVRMNDCGVLVPHGLCGHSRTLLLASANRLRQQAVPAVPENKK